MKNLTAAICLTSVILSGSFARANQTCFQGADPFFRPFTRIENTKNQASSLWAACEELDRKDMAEGQNLIATLFFRTAGTFGFGIMFGHGVAAFEDLNDTPEEIAYKTQLERIKQIENPMERIRLVYQLAASVQGSYDDKTLGLRTWKNGAVIFAETPSNLLKSAKQNGTAGVCREFASLLQWSLLQVARHPSSKQAALSEKDFSSEMIAGKVPGGGHAWVRAHLPVHDKQGQILGFNDFDLDTTWYPEQFSILYPRRSGISEDTRVNLANQCQRILDCLTSEASYGR